MCCSVKATILLLLCALCATVASTELDETRATQLSSITSLEANCARADNICRGFNYANATIVAFFDLKAEIRINPESTYEVGSPLAGGYDKLIFENSTFAHFPLHLFYALEDLKELDMRNCAIELVTWENFLMASNLRVLLLSHNQLRRLDAETFGYAFELQFLFLDSNQLRTLESDSFKGLKKLRHLDLSTNRLYELPADIFEHLPALHEVNLAANHLHAIGDELFASNFQLQRIQLQENRLQAISENAFKSQRDLLLDISHNQRLEALVITLSAQHLNAVNCSLYRVNVYGGLVEAHLSDNHIMELYFSQPEILELLNLRNNALQQISSLALVVRLHTLVLADNPGMANGLPSPWSVDSLTRLDLSNTSLQQLPHAALASQPNLRVLNVSNNKLRAIEPQHFVYLSQLTHFQIHANDWNCYNLNIMMNLLIQPRGISYKRDTFDANFPGEYIHGIACMYRLDDNDDNAATATVAEVSSVGERLQLISKQDELELASVTFITPEEITSLRRELKAIVGFYEAKFDKAFALIDDLNARLSEFERLNRTVWQHVTITT